MTCRGETYLEAEGDGWPRVTCKHGLVPSNKTIKILIHSIHQRDSIPSSSFWERNRALRVKLIKVILTVVWDILALREHDLPLAPIIDWVLGLDHRRRPRLKQSQYITQLQQHGGLPRQVEEPNNSRLEGTMKQICLRLRCGGDVPGTIADAPQVEDKCRAPGGPKFEQHLQRRDRFYLQFAREGKELVWHLARAGDNLIALAGPEEPQYGDRDRTFWRGSNTRPHQSRSRNDKLHRRNALFLG